jgi:DNA invertase Pin-like site-specific DNA recombinase
MSGKRLEGRSGFMRMCELIEKGEVAVVMAAEIDRLSRDKYAAQYFLRRARRAGVVLWAKGKFYDIAGANLAELFGLEVEVILGWYDNESRLRRFSAGRRAKVGQGFAVSRPPIGYVAIARDRWAKDPDPDIQEAVRRVFDLYSRLGSTPRVLKYCHQNGLLFPRRRLGEVRWAKITPMQIMHVLHNPNYTDAYVYYRNKVSGADDWQPRTVEQRPRSQWSIVRGHHDGYISWEDWETLQEILTSRRVVARPPIGRGPALLQGLLRCVRCDRVIRTVYKMRVGARRLPSYECRPVDEFGHSRRCFSAASSALDGLVVQEVLSSLAPVGIGTALAAARREMDERTNLERLHQRILQRAQEEVEETRRRYERVDEANPLVKKDLEARYEATLRQKQQLTAEYERSERRRDPPLDSEEVSELIAFATEIPELWAARTTTNEDRKQLIQAVVRRIRVHGRSEEATEIEIEWVGGLREKRRALRPKGIDEIVLEVHRSGCRNVGEIVDVLRARGALNNFGRPISKQVIWNSLKRLGQHRRPTWVRALRLIRGMVLAGRSNREILARLLTEGPHHWRGDWTVRRVEVAIGRLRVGRLPQGVEPLPPDMKRQSFATTPSEAVEVIVRGRASRLSWRSIVEDLEARELRTASGRYFSVALAASLYSRWRHKGLVS